MKNILTILSHNTDNNRFYILLLLLIPCIVFVQCIGFGLTGFDDTYIISDVYMRTRDIPQSEEMVKQNAIQALGNFGNVFYRPVQFATYVIDSTISGQMSWMYHLTNICIHLATVVLLFLFLKLHFRKFHAFLASSIFSIHPFFASWVAWIPSRGDVLLGLFGLLLFISFHWYTQTNKPIYFIGQSLLFLFLIFTKETAILFPPLLITYSLVVLHKKLSFKETALLGASWFIPALIYYIVRKMSIEKEGSGEFFGISSFLKNLSAIPTTFGNFFLPIKLSPLPLFDKTSAAIGVILFIPSLYFIIRSLQQRNWLPAFGFAWFLLFTIPPMFYRIPHADYYFNYLEHRTYLPFIGLLIGTTSALDVLSAKISRRYIVAAFAVVMTGFSVLAFQHTGDYNSGLVFFDHAITAEPQNAMAYLCKGLNEASIGQYDNALSLINHSIKIFKFPATFYHRGCLYEAMHDTATAERDYTVALMLDSTLTLAYVSRAAIESHQGEYQEALRDLTDAIASDSTFSIAYYDRANIYLALKQHTNAYRDFSQAIDLLPTYTSALINRGITLYEMHSYQAALLDYQRALLLQPKNVLIYNNMGVTYRELGKYEEAIGYFNKALSLNPNFGAAYYGRGTIELMLNQKTSACNDWLRATQLGFSAAKLLLKIHCVHE